MRMTGLWQTMRQLLGQEGSPDASDPGLPTLPVLLRTSRGCRLTPIQAMSLVLKGLWEHFLQSPEADSGGAPGPLGVIDGLRFDFQPDLSVLSTLPLEQLPPAVPPGDQATLLRISRELLLGNLHRADLFDPAVSRFEELANEEAGLLAAASAEMANRYRERRNHHVALRWDLERSLFTLEKRRILDQVHRAQWMTHFGDEFRDREQLSEDMRELETQIQLLLEDPNLTEEDLGIRTAEARQEFQNRLKTMEIESQLGVLLRDRKETSLPPEDIAEFEGSLRNALFTTWKRIHPDVLARQPGFGQLTEEQQRQIEELQRRLSLMKSTDLVRTPLSGKTREEFLMTLEILGGKVEQILAHAGIDLNVDLLVPGETLAKRLEWLEKDIRRLEAGIRNARYGFEQVRADPFMNEVRACLQRPDLHEIFRSNLKAHIEVLKGRITELQEQRRKLLKGLVPQPLEEATTTEQIH